MTATNPTITSDGTKQWLLNDLFHRLDGPAIEWADGTGDWFVNGRELTSKEERDLKAKLARPRGRGGR